MTWDDYSTVKGAPLMHRYQLPALDGFEVVVGFDHPMRTYFAQVYDADGEIVLDRGDAIDRLLHPRQALEAVRDYATEVPTGTEDNLVALAHEHPHRDPVLIFLPALSAEHAVYLGWDPQGRTFFAVVEDAHEQFLVDRGRHGDLLLSAAVAVNAVREFTDLPSDLADELVASLRDAA